MDTRSLENVLPHGNGIDYDWTFEVDTNKTVIASNGWHYINNDGFYIGCIEFCIRLHTDGTVELPVMADETVLADSELGYEISANMLENPEDVDTLDFDDRCHYIEAELNSISDVIFDKFNAIDKNILAEEVSKYIKSECELEFLVPGFWGFYESSYTDAGELEYMFFSDYEVLDRKSKDLCRKFFDNNMDWNINSEYTDNVGITYCEIFDKAMRDVIHSWGTTSFKTIISPKYYNYDSDEIHATAIFSDEVCDEIMDYLDAHRNEFAEYIREHFTSHDGFVSFYSNDVEVWNKHITRMDRNEINAVLDFILLNNGVDISQINNDTIEKLECNCESYSDYIVEKNIYNLKQYVTENGGYIE